MNVVRHLPSSAPGCHRMSVAVVVFVLLLLPCPRAGAEEPACTPENAACTPAAPESAKVMDAAELATYIDS